LEADVRDLPSVFGEPVDGVMASHIIEHLSPDEVTTLLTELAAVVRPGGVAVLATPNLRDWRVVSEWFWQDPTHVRPYPAGAVKQLLRPNEWRWEADGYEPVVVTRRTPLEFANRVRFGASYGRPGRWYRLRRVQTGV
jgi:2-polyprenyl-3-methyl-5-hydroxy-6-metoxy-1,4-benzoquinol methylase